MSRMKSNLTFQVPLEHLYCEPAQMEAIKQVYKNDSVFQQTFSWSVALQEYATELITKYKLGIQSVRKLDGC